MDSMAFELTQYDIDNKEICISPIFKRNITHYDNNKYIVQLDLSIKTSEENPLPFNIEIIMTGYFELYINGKNDNINNKKIIKNNTVAIMFPFLRSALATLTTAANIDPLIIPVINVTQMFKDEDDC